MLVNEGKCYILSAVLIMHNKVRVALCCESVDQHTSECKIIIVQVQ